MADGCERVVMHHDCIGCPYATQDEKRAITRLPGGETINLETSELTVDGVAIRLEKGGARLLAQMGRRFGRLVDLDALILAYGNNESEDPRNIVSTVMSRLRARLRQKAPHLKITSIYGQGWVLTYLAPVESLPEAPETPIRGLPRTPHFSTGANHAA